jgi:hypothetical protein
VNSKSESENTTSLMILLPNHRADLRASGLSDVAIERWGCYSVEVDQKWVMSQLGFGHLQPPALALPVLTLDLNTPDLNSVVLKPDLPRRDGRGRPAKYEVRPGSRNRVHVPLAIRSMVQDASVPLVITEGQKKAEAGAQAGICAVALFGVWN